MTTRTERSNPPWRFEFVQRWLCAHTRRFRAAQAHIDTERIPGRAARECSDLCCGRSGSHELPSGTPEFIPLHQRRGASRPSGLSRLRAAKNNAPKTNPTPDSEDANHRTICAGILTMLTPRHLQCGFWLGIPPRRLRDH